MVNERVSPFASGSSYQKIGDEMGTKVKELDNSKNGDRGACPLCNPPDPKKKVTASQVWAATQKFGGKSHVRSS